MFKIFKLEIKKRMEGWSKRKLKTCKFCLLLGMICFYISIIFLISNLKKSKISADMQDIVFSSWLLIFTILGFLSVKMLCIIASIQKENEEKEEKTTAFSKLQKVLSPTEYRKVLYSPNLKRYDGIVSYEDGELTYCLNLLRNDGIIHYAIIDGDCVRVISKNTAGKQIGHRTISATEFCKKYEVIEE